MKNICFLLCFLLINSFNSVIGGMQDDAAEVLRRCKTEVNASVEDVKMILDKKMPTTHSGLCLLTCLYESAGIINDGKFVVGNLTKVIGASETLSVGGRMAKQFIEEVTNDCKHVENDDKCILSKDILMCAAESVKRHSSLLKEL